MGRVSAGEGVGDATTATVGGARETERVHAGFSLRDKEEVPHGAAGCEGGMRGQARGLAAHKTASFTKFRLLRLTITGSILTLTVKLKISRRGGLSIMHPSGSRQTQMSA